MHISTPVFTEAATSVSIALSTPAAAAIDALTYDFEEIAIVRCIVCAIITTRAAPAKTVINYVHLRYNGKPDNTHAAKR